MALIVLGSRGVGRFARLLTGSTSSKVARHAHCPVVIIPPADRR
jgi:nucleotide-binding universal stress UspA family protein